MQRVSKPLFVLTATALLMFSSSCKKKPQAGATPDFAAGPGGSASGDIVVDPNRGVADDSVRRVIDGTLQLKDNATKYDVSYSPETVLLSKDAVRQSLQKVSDDGATYTFDASSSEAQKLHAGSVMLLTGIALRKVTGATRTGGTLVVTTEPAAITDAIANGKIQSKTKVDFGAMKAAIESSPHSHWSIVPAVYAQGGGSVAPDQPGALKFSIQIEPFKYSIKFTKGDGQMNIEMKVSDTTANLEFKATGYIKDYQSLLDVAVANGTVTDLDFSNSDLESDVTVNWSAASAVAGPMNKIASWSKMLQTFAGLKDVAVTLPFLVGPIPFTLKITSGIVFTPAFTSKNTVMTGSLNVHYSGSAGFSVSNGNSQPSGSITQPSQANPESQILSLGPIGFTVAVEFPRLELGMGLNFVTFSPAAYVSPVTSFGIVYGGPAAMLPCETHIMDVTVSTGVQANSTVWSFLSNKTKLNVDKEIYKKHYTGPKPGMMLCPT